MEVAGLALGVVGIAGVIGAFKDAVDVFGLIADSKQLGRDYEVLESKLDIEKTVLLHWANRTKLLDLDYDRRLDEPSTRQAVVKILSSIHLLLSDAEPLRQRYGLEKGVVEQEAPKVDAFIEYLASVQNPQEYQDQMRNAKPGVEVDPSPISENRMKSFITKFESLQIRMNVRQRESSKRNKLRWIVADKAKFEVLIQDLAYFTTKLHAVLPASNNFFQVLADEDLQTERSLRELKILLEASTGRRAAVASSTRRAIAKLCEDRILQRLWFRTIGDRRSAISPAHKQTLRWALGPPGQGQLHWDDLSAWLTGTNPGIYWVSGKAGSGKSTLMKYLFQEQKTHDFLRRWSQYVILGDFFFSHAGTIEQKSQGGLARTLLHQILCRNRQLIPELLPAMWKEMHDMEDDTQHSVSLPSWSEITHAFSALTTLSADMGKLRFCFFIDGLDELEGDTTKVIEFIKTVAANPRVKIVLSSRPIPECVNAFSNLPSLHLHHLTRNDIVVYIQNRLGGVEYMERLVRRHRQQAEDLIQQIAEKSSGVFLWVILACRSVLSGFADCDRISELRKRVDELPPELEVMFQHMLGSVNERHKKQGARLLRVCYEIMKFSKSAHSVRVSTLGLALVDDGMFQPEDVASLTFEEKADLCKDMDGRLRSRCGGLLEVKLAKYGAWAEMQGFAGNAVMAHGTRLVESEVVFMHRTIYEFLEDPLVWHLECLAMPTDGSSIAGFISVLGSYQAMSALAEPASAFSDSELQKDLDFCLLWGVKSDELVPDVEDNIFSTLIPILGLLKSRSRNSTGLFQRLAASSSSDPGGCQHTPLLLAIETGARNFAKKHLGTPVDGKHPKFRCGCFPPLYHAVRQPLLCVEYEGFRNRYGSMLDTKKTISTLLAEGCNPNEAVESCLTRMTPWSAWLSALDHVNDVGESEKLICADIIEMFLRAGASATRDEYMTIGRAFLGRDVSTNLQQRGEELLNLFQMSRDPRQNRRRASAVSSLSEQRLGGASRKRRRTRY